MMKLPGAFRDYANAPENRHLLTLLPKGTWWPVGKVWPRHLIASPCWATILLSFTLTSLSLYLVLLI